MVIVVLDDKIIDSGKRLLQQLDQEKLVFDAALWLLYPETQKWKLILSFPNLIRRGPKAAYRLVQDVIPRVDNMAFSLDDVEIVKTDNSILNLLRTEINTGDSIGGIRFTNNVISGQLIQDAYIYRLTNFNPNINKQKISI